MADIRLDEATRKSLLGLMPFTQAGTMDFIPALFVGIAPEFTPVFKQRAFTHQELAAVRKLYADKVEDKTTILWETVRKTVTGWEKMFDLASGQTLTFKADPDGGLDKDLWESLPLVIRRELTTNVSIMSGLLEQEKTGLK
jgi:hypothetical protein